MKFSLVTPLHLYRTMLAVALIVAALLGLLARTPTPAGATSGLSVFIGGDQLSEGNIGTTTATFAVDIIDNDPPLMCDISNPDSCDPVFVQVCLDYHTVDGTAHAGEDYVATSGTLQITASTGGFDTSAGFGLIDVPVIGDTTPEDAETFSVVLAQSSLCPPRAAIRIFEAQATINDDDTSRLSVTDRRVTETNSGFVATSVKVTLSPPSSQPVQVAFATQALTATAGADFEPTAGSLTFAPGETSKLIALKVFGDAINELDEDFRVNLSNSVNAAIADGQGNVSIADDDASQLRLLSLRCNDKNDPLGNDEPFLKVAGQTVFSSNDFTVGQSVNLQSVPAKVFSGSIIVELWEADIAPNADDLLGNVTISETALGTGTRTVTFALDGAQYVLQYRVD